MKKTIILLVAVVLMAACNSKAPKDNNETSNETTYTVTSLLESADKLVNKEVTVKGLVVHVCKHGGQKMFITSEDKETKIKINVSETITEFDVALEGSMVEINGLVVAVIEAPHKEGDGENEASMTEETENHQAEEVEETEEIKGCASKEGEECETEECETEECETKDSVEEDSVEEEECDFEKETIVYEIKALSFKEVTE